MKIPRKVSLLAGAAFILAVVWFAKNVSQTAETAERNTAACLLIIDVTTKYIREVGKWPASWSDLRSVLDTSNDIYSWPRDSAEMENRVHVDFGLTLEQVARQEPESFTAIEPKGLAWSRHAPASLLLMEARKCVGRRNGDGNKTRKGETRKDRLGLRAGWPRVIG